MWGNVLCLGNTVCIMTDMPTTCQYFALCDNPAEGVVPNPILGNVPCCQRCADRVGAELLFNPANPNPDLLPDPIAGWHDVHANMVLLTSYLADHGSDAGTVAHAVEKPWNYQDEFKLALWELDRDTLSEDAR